MSRSGDPADPRGKLSSGEATELAAQVAELAKAGLPLPSGLRALADELPGRRLPGVLRDISSLLEAGVSLEAAIHAQGPRLPAHVRGLITAGVRSGRLPELLDEFIDSQRDRAELGRRVWTSLAYPIFLLVMLSILCIFLQTGIVPQMAELYESFETALPTVTVLFLQVSGPGTWALAVGTLFVIGTLVLLATIPGVVWVRRLLCVIPLVGPLWRWSRLAQFSKLMELLLEREVPLPEALRLAALGTRDADLEAGCRQVAAEVEAGRPLAESLASSRQFPPSMIPLIQWAQQAAAVPEGFRAAAEMFQRRVRTQGRVLDIVLLPVTFMVIAAFILFFIVAMYLPLISMFGQLT